MNDQYNNYAILDFAQEDSFIRWVRHQDESATLFWEQWLADHPDKASDIQAARQLVKSIKIEESPNPPQQVDRIWGKIAEELPANKTQQVPTKTRSISRWIPYVAAAASIAILIFFLFPSGDANQLLLAQNGEQKTFYLPDSSEVEINAGSKVLVNVDDWTDTRAVKLEGEAFFKVKKGSRFIVNTPNGNVEVLGTSFNVNTRDGELIVECFTGKVKVSSDKVDQSKILTPLQGVKLEAGTNTWKNYAVSTDRQATWRAGKFYYDKTPLIQVLSELERQFNVQIEVEEKEHFREYNGFFERGDLDKAFNNICYPMNLTYERKGDVVILKSK